MKAGIVLLLAVCACSRSGPEEPASLRAMASTSAWAATVVSRNEAVDRLLDQHDAAGARQILTSIVESGPDVRGVPSETRRVLLQDAHFRLARLELDAGDARASVRQAAAGLALGGDEDLFVANLLVARGSAREALGETEAALADYDHALRVNEALLQRTLSPP